MSKRRVAIVGFEPISRKEAPLKDKSWEIWTMNSDHELISKSDRHFEMHDLAVYGDRAVDDVSPDPKYLKMLRRGLGVPVYMLAAHDDIPGCVPYPIKEVVAKFGPYFTNSVSYMLALAIHERVDEIGVYGIDMAREHENGWERPSIEYFLGRARGMGMKVTIPDTSDLLKCLGLYGYIEAYEHEAELREYRANLKAKISEHNNAAQQLRGALDDVEYWLRRGIFVGDKPANEKARARKAWLAGRAKKYQDVANKLDGYLKADPE